MNNKIIARIVAAVMAIAMLGTVSFAASLSGNAIEVANPTGDYASQTQKTAIAFYATSADATTPAASDIIAVYQADNGAAMPTTFPIDTTKYTEGKTHVVVRFGGNATDDPSSVAIPLSGTAIDTVNFANTITVGEAEYTGVVYFTAEIPAGTIANYGFKVINETGNAKTPVFFTGDTQLSGDGPWNYGVLIIGAPNATAENWSCEAFYNN